jgi:hypothetical protein
MLFRLYEIVAVELELKQHAARRQHTKLSQQHFRYAEFAPTYSHSPSIAFDAVNQYSVAPLVSVTA